MEWVTPALALVVLCVIAWIYRQLSGLRRAVEPAWLHLDAALRRRHDQLSPLIRLLREELPGKIRSLDAATQARKMATGSGLSPEHTAIAEHALTRAIEPLLALAENHAHLAANPHYGRMVAVMNASQAEIATAASVFNQAVLRYGAAKRRGLNLVMARLFNFSDIEFFAGTKAEREALDAALGGSFWSRA